MVTWNNLDTLTSYAKLKDLKDHVDIKEAMAGENGAKRVAEYSAPMASGLSFNYAAKQVDDEVLDVLAELADEHQLVDKFEDSAFCVIKPNLIRKSFVKLFFGFLILLSYGTISFCESKYIEKRKVIWKIEKNFHLELDFF